MEVQAETETATDVVITVARLIPVTVGRAAILRIVVPGTATQLNPVPYPTYSTFFGGSMTPKKRRFFPRFARRREERKKEKRVKE